MKWSPEHVHLLAYMTDIFNNKIYIKSNFREVARRGMFRLHIFVFLKGRFSSALEGTSAMK